MAEYNFKVIPQIKDWSNASVLRDGYIECPVCFTPVFPDSVQKHTAWHEMIGELIKVLAR